MTLLRQDTASLVRKLKASEPYEQTLENVADRLDAIKLEAVAHAEVIQEARNIHTSDDLEIDDEPELSIGEGGIWVAAWVWVSVDTEEEELT